MTSELMVAVVAAGSAVLGSGVTGFFAWRAGRHQAEALLGAAQKQADAAWAAAQRQAEGAIAAAQKQADVQLEVIRESHRQQVSSATRESKRRIYADYLNNADQWAKIVGRLSNASRTGQDIEVLDRLDAAREENHRMLIEMSFEASMSVMLTVDKITAAIDKIIDDPEAHYEEFQRQRIAFIMACREELDRDIPQAGDPESPRVTP